jgi:hypothetical protein
MALTVGFWNILADGLSAGEFMSRTPDESLNIALWEKRGPKVARILSEMLQTCALVGVVENDHAQGLLHCLQRHDPTIKAVHVIKGRYHKSNAYKFFHTRSSKELLQAVRPVSMVVNGSQTEEEYNTAMRAKMFAGSHDMDSYSAALDLYRTALRVGVDAVADDGLTIYFRSDLVRLQMTDTRTLLTTLTRNSDLQETGDTSYFTWSFQRIADSTPFKITVAHLKSGADFKGARQRTRELTVMISDPWVRESIILMDSNFSAHYPDGHSHGHLEKNTTYAMCPRCVDISNANRTNIVLAGESRRLLSTVGFVDALSGSKGNECLKMRHAAGNQPKKFCEFMFDRLDRIMVPRNFTTSCHPVEVKTSFQRYDPAHTETLTLYRTDRDLRNGLRQAGRAGMWFSADECTGTFPALHCLYPNDDAPSDHPPVSADIFLTPNHIRCPLVRSGCIAIREAFTRFWAWFESL